MHLDLTLHSKTQYIGYLGFTNKDLRVLMVLQKKSRIGSDLDPVAVQDSL